MPATLNTTVLMSGVDYFDNGQAINPFMKSNATIDVPKAHSEHEAIMDAFAQAGIFINQRPAPEGCQDGVYTANWAFVLDNIALMSRLPNARKGEEAHAESILRNMGYQIEHVPEDWLFSGQGDALYVPGTETIFAGYGYRTDRRVHDFLAELFKCQVVSLHAIPQRSFLGIKNLRVGTPVINASSGLADSPAYDIDLAVGILKPKDTDQNPLIAYCPDLLDAKSRQVMQNLEGFDKITVTRSEALNAYACNLVSSGQSVILNKGATKLIADLKAHSLRGVGLANDEISKGGGGFRCVSLTLDNRLHS